MIITLTTAGAKIALAHINSYSYGTIHGVETPAVVFPQPGIEVVVEIPLVGRKITQPAHVVCNKTGSRIIIVSAASIVAARVARNGEQHVLFILELAISKCHLMLLQRLPESWIIISWGGRGAADIDHKNGRRDRGVLQSCLLVDNCVAFAASFSRIP